MHYFRNFELAKQYRVSQTAVGKWIEATKAGRLTLDLIEHEGKSYIAATSKNRVTIEALVHDRKKYFNSKSHKTVSPKAEFYTTFMPDQVADIIVTLDRQAEIPLQYSYFDKGAGNWEKRLNRLIRENIPSASTCVVDQLITNRSYLDDLLKDYTIINVIDVGAGNGYPAKELLEYLLKRKVLNRYLALDISPEMLIIAEKNIKKWFGKKVKFSSDLRDITCERFADLLTNPTKDPGSIVNLVLFFGSTLSNFDNQNEVLRTIYHSLNRNDILLYSLKLDTGGNRSSFDVPKAYIQDVVTLLGISSSFYNVEMGFDEQKNERYVRLRLKIAISIIFNLPQGKRIVEFKKDESILVWRYKHQNAEEVIKQFTDNGFNILQSSQTPDHEFMLLVCDLKTERK